MTGHVAGIFRHPVKGFTPEPLTAVDLAPGVGFPCDRIYAVENGPCGFDPAAPAFIPKQKFTVLAALPQVAAVRTRYHDATGDLEASAPGAPDFFGCLAEAAGREAFAAWLTDVLGEEARGPLRVIAGAEAWRFTDHPLGQVSIINLASVADLSARMGVELDPLRFRANLYVDGWPPWIETEWPGRTLRVGPARLEVFSSIVRCVATHVDPDRGERDLDVTAGLYEGFGHILCGVYASVARGGTIAPGDEVAPLP